MNNHPLFVAGGSFGISAALALPARAAETVAATHETVLIPLEILVFAFVVTIGLICFGMTRERAQAIWIHALALLTATFGLGCSFAAGFTVSDGAALANIAVTNIGLTYFAAALLVFALIMLIYSILAEMHTTAESA